MTVVCQDSTPDHQQPCIIQTASTMVFICQQGQRVFFFLLGSLWNIGPTEMCTRAGGNVPVKVGEKRSGDVKGMVWSRSAY